MLYCAKNVDHVCYYSMKICQHFPVLATLGGQSGTLNLVPLALLHWAYLISTKETDYRFSLLFLDLHKWQLTQTSELLVRSYHSPSTNFNCSTQQLRPTFVNLFGLVS